MKGYSTKAHFDNTIGGMPFGPIALDISRFIKVVKTSSSVILMCER